MAAREIISPVPEINSLKPVIQTVHSTHKLHTFLNHDEMVQQVPFFSPKPDTSESCVSF